MMTRLVVLLLIILKCLNASTAVSYVSTTIPSSQRHDTSSKALDISNSWKLAGGSSYVKYEAIVSNDTPFYFHVVTNAGSATMPLYSPGIIAPGASGTFIYIPTSGNSYSQQITIILRLIDSTNWSASFQTFMTCTLSTSSGSSCIVTYYGGSTSTLISNTQAATYTGTSTNICVTSSSCYNLVGSLFQRADTGTTTNMWQLRFTNIGYTPVSPCYLS